MSCLFMDIPDFEYEKCVYWIKDGCKDNDPNCGNSDALCNETIERIKQLEADMEKQNKFIRELEGDIDRLNNELEKGYKNLKDWSKESKEQNQKLRRDEIKQMKAVLKKVERECMKMVEAGWYDSGEFKMQKSEMARIIVDINVIAEKTLEDK